MKKLNVIAVALAAALTTLAAQAQEQPAAMSPADLEAAFAALGKDEKGEAKGDKKAEAKRGSDQPGQAKSKDEIDETTTASVSARDRPSLAAKARKETVVGKTKQPAAAKKTVAVAKNEYSTIIARYASTYGVPVALAHAVVSIESNFRPNARGSAGEIGLMQIKPATARMMGYSGSAKGLFNPETNIKYGMKYLAKAHQLGGGATCGTILKYNAGHAARRMNKVSAAYCAKVKRHIGA